MKKRKCISRKSLPVGLPVFRTAVLILVLDRVGAPGWAWGVAATLMALWWIGSLWVIAEQKGVDVFAADASPATRHVTGLFTFDGTAVDVNGKVTTAKASGR